MLTTLTILYRAQTRNSLRQNAPKLHGTQVSKLHKKVKKLDDSKIKKTFVDRLVCEQSKKGV
jgi:hypothetical protein